MTTLQICIALSQLCIEGVERLLKDGTGLHELSENWSRRDRFLGQLAAQDRLVFSRWATGKMTDEETASVLATEAA
jgi:hypothetical protein